MLEEIRAKCKKSLKKQMIWSGAIALVLLLAPLMAPLSLILGPREMPDAGDLEKYKGKYVSYEIEYAFDYYVESYTVNSDTGRRTSTNSYGYVVYDWESNTCFAIEMQSKYDDEMNDIMEETAEYFYYGTAPTTKLEATGTLAELEGKELEYFKESVEDLEEYIPGIMDAAAYYVIDYNEVNGVPIVLVVFAWMGIAVCLWILVVALIKMLTNKADKKLKKFLDTHMTVREDQIDADLRAAKKIGGSVWAGQLFTVYIASSAIQIIDNRDLVWAYYYKRTGRYAVSQVRTFNKDKKMVAINLSEALSKQLLNAYVDTQPQMVLGYDRDLEKQYNKNFSEFLNLRYNPAKQQAAENTAEYASTDYSDLV